MAGIKDIREILNRYSGIKYESTDLDIKIPKLNDDGYDIYLVVHIDGITLYLDGWHEEYNSIEEAWADFVAAMTPNVRLKVTARGKFRHKWQLQLLNNEFSKSGWVVSMMFYPFWRKKHEFYLQNRIVTNKQTIKELLVSLTKL